MSVLAAFLAANWQAVAGVFAAIAAFFKRK